MTNQRNASIAVGTTTLVAAVGFVVLLILFGFTPQWLKTGYVLTVNMPSGGGLATGSRVTLNGIGVGSVEDVKLAPNGDGVTVTARMRRKARIPQGVRGEVSQSLFGVASDLVLIPPDDVANQPTLPIDGSAQIQGDVFTAAQQFSGAFTSAFADSSSTIDDLTADVQRLTREWAAVGEGINRFVNNPTGNPDAPSIGKLFNQAEATLTSIRATLDHADTIIRDPKLRTDLNDTFANAERVSAQAETLAKRYTALADDLSVSIQQANALLAAANDKNGTLGKLTQDPALYNNLDDATKRLQQLLDEARLLIEKWKKEGLPIQL